ncbi:hypothetical protein [Roseateles terrae]|uniref:DUF4123 domain-containing protein n=1 Tax=Roseateles terrae TaxID=431060 RepID=A0ABR6GSI8_9BURK|nr:hypothetical protein [Roseateles terrae]MBB3195075.1 hypothetical protein [Roseateles terrae]OWQ87108.1 hypothetical protein CDN98_09615 [Roseateles terrae]
MSRLQAEFDRLYAATATATATATAPEAAGGLDLISADGRVRALVLDIGRPVDWSVVAPLWRAVQEDLAWPAPAIAIAGGPSFQLWWSLEEAVAAQDAARFLQAVQRRFLPELKEVRVQRFPAPSPGEELTDTAAGWTHARPVPAAVTPDQWSAFVAPGLAPVFEETPWLDFPPNEEGQAELLRGLRSISPVQWQDAWKGLGQGVEAALNPGETSAISVGVLKTTSDAAAGRWTAADPDEHADADAAAAVAKAIAPFTSGVPSRSPTFSDPRAFLMQVMNDSAVPMALRIEAAKALLPLAKDQ